MTPVTADTNLIQTFDTIGHLAPATDLLPLLPVLVLAGFAFFILMLDLFLKEGQRRLTHWLAVGSLLLAAGMTAAGTGGDGSVFGGMFLRDTMANVLNVFILLLSAAALMYVGVGLRDRGLYKGEVPVLVLFSAIGMMLLTSAGNMVLVYLGLEMLALCSYALVAVDRDNPRSSEAAMKYFVLGSLASGLLLYGMSLIYGASGTLDLALLREAVAVTDDRGLLLTGVVFLVAGIAFKFGAAPFHMWLPDTYHGAPTSITLFIGSAPKLAAFAMAWRLLEAGLGPVQANWSLLLSGLAVASLLVGNLIALMQTNMKRMLAYSTISHVGFLLLGLVGGTADAYAAAMFYAIAYGIMSVAAFGAIVMLSSAGFEAEQIDDFKGLNARSPWMAGLVLLIMASLAGVPPLLGFWAKMAVLRAALEGGFLWLAITGVVFAVIGAFYYLRVIKVMYVDTAEGDTVVVRRDTGLRLVFAINALALLVLGIFWNPLMAWCQAAFA